jgi:hypothetical protein
VFWFFNIAFVPAWPAGVETRFKDLVRVLDSLDPLA